MPWVFIGGEMLCYLGISFIFIFMGVEKFSKFDHIAIVCDQKAAAQAEGRRYISAEEKIRLEEGEQAYREEMRKQVQAAKKEAARIASLPRKERIAEEEAAAKVEMEFNALRKAAGRPPVKI